MSLVCVRVDYIRPFGFIDLKEWMKESNNIYIGRKKIVYIDDKPFPEEDSPFVNPFKLYRDGDIDQINQKYRDYILKKLEDPNFLLKFLSLRDKKLGCWCYPHYKCHGSILLELLNEIKQENIKISIIKK